MSTALQTRPDPDYRLIFWKEKEFANRIRDIYLSRAKMRPPFFDEIVEDMWDMMALVYIECAGAGLTTTILSEAQHIIHGGDPIAGANFIYEYAGADFHELFIRDVYRYLLHNGLNFLFRNAAMRVDELPILINSSITPVW